MAWSAADIPDQSGRTVVVTGANAGLGFRTALELARRGAHVVMGARDPARGQRALERLRAEAFEASAELAELDLADLASVERFAAGVLERPDGLDVLVDNAGVMAVPTRETTAQGFERQFGVNHLGHFALTGRLLPALLARPGSRVVVVGSNNHKYVNGLDFDDLQSQRRYDPWGAYNCSKLANCLFALELDRRMRAAGLDVVSVGAHPGYTHTNLQYAGPRSGRTPLFARLLGLMTPLLAQSEAAGALPQLYAAVAPGVRGGEYYGPSGPGEFRGPPRRRQFSAAARDEAAAARLWAASEELTGVTWPALHSR